MGKYVISSYVIMLLTLPLCAVKITSFKRSWIMNFGVLSGLSNSVFTHCDVIFFELPVLCNILTAIGWFAYWLLFEIPEFIGLCLNVFTPNNWQQSVFCCSLDVVFSLPGKLIYSKNHSVILTVFHADVEEEIAALIVVRNQPNSRQIYRHQVLRHITETVNFLTRVACVSCL